MRYFYVLHFERSAELYHVPRLHYVELCVVDMHFAQFVFYKRERELCTEHGHIALLEKIRDRPDMVLVPVRYDYAADPVAIEQ